MTDDNDVIARLEAKIETVIRLLALQLLTKGQTLREQSLLLHRAGLSTLEIARLCDTVPGTINKALSQAKHERKF